jgi:hypothetical protein
LASAAVLRQGWVWNDSRLASGGSKSAGLRTATPGRFITRGNGVGKRVAASVREDASFRALVQELEKGLTVARV